MNENNGQFNGSDQNAQQGAYAPPGARGPFAQGAQEQGCGQPQGIPGQGQYPSQGTETPGQGQYPPPYAYAPPRRAASRRVFPIDKKDRILAPVLLLLCGFGVFAGLWGGFHAGFTVSYGLLFLALTVYLAKKGTAPGAYATLCGVLSLALSGVFVATENDLLRFFSVIALVCTSVVWFSALSGKRSGRGELSLIGRILTPIGDAAGEMPRTVRSLSSAKDGGRRGVPKALLGVLCAIPLLCAVVPLLISSDAAFEGMVGSVFESVGSVVFRVLLTLAVTPFVLAFAFALRKKPREEKTEKARKGVDTAFLTAFTGALSVCYLVYLFSQLAYVVSAFSGFLPVDFTYAEYARRGFFELCAIAAIDLAVLYLTILLSRKKEEKMPGVLRAVCTFLGLFTMFLIASALAKNVMYIRQYGMTVLRVGSGAFLLALAAVFLAAVLRCHIRRVRAIPVALISFACTLCALGLADIDRGCAKYNYEAYTAGSLKEIDCAYLGELGEAGVPYLTELAMRGNGSDAAEAREELFWAVEDLYDGEWKDIWTKNDIYFNYLEPQRRKYPAPSQFSVPRQRAYAALDAFLKEDPELMRNMAEEIGGS